MPKQHEGALLSEDMINKSYSLHQAIVSFTKKRSIQADAPLIK